MKNSREVAILLHDIRSVHNVGSIFRTADALGVTKIYLSGYTPTPIDKFNRPRKDFIKVSLGAEQSVAWEYVANPEVILKKLQKEQYQIIGLEQTATSVDYTTVTPAYPFLFIIGNEVSGIPENILHYCDVVAEIPMKGVKESLNVSVAFGIGLARMINR